MDGCWIDGWMLDGWMDVGWLEEAELKPTQPKLAGAWLSLAIKVISVRSIEIDIGWVGTEQHVNIFLSCSLVLL